MLKMIRELWRKKKVESIAIIVSVFAFLVSIKSCQISNESNEISKNALKNTKSAFITERRPYLYVDVKPIIKAIAESESSGGRASWAGITINYKNVGSFTASNIEIEAKIIDDVDDYMHDLAEWFIKEYGSFPYPTTLFPGQEVEHSYVVSLPYVPKNGKMYIYAAIRIKYKGFSDDEYNYWVDYIYWFERDGKGLVYRPVPIKNFTSWDMNKNLPMPGIEVPDWSKYKKKN